MSLTPPIWMEVNWLKRKKPGKINHRYFYLGGRLEKIKQHEKNIYIYPTHINIFK